MELKDRLTARISELDVKKNEALIEFGKALGAVEECQFILNFLNANEGAGNTAPESNEGESQLDQASPEITIFDPSK